MPSICTLLMGKTKRKLKKTCDETQIYDFIIILSNYENTNSLNAEFGEHNFPHEIPFQRNCKAVDVSRGVPELPEARSSHVNCCTCDVAGPHVQHHRLNYTVSRLEHATHRNETGTAIQDWLGLVGIKFGCHHVLALTKQCVLSFRFSNHSCHSINKTLETSIGTKWNENDADENPADTG